ncbi:M48 family metallopeptidase [Pendulispora rubella]|uniref:M48 family metallopeptidase n=1 Tax=Pendulispora rubella TaxID=2741070 RepID=A0ABZ2LEC3_9BACT
MKGQRRHGSWTVAASALTLALVGVVSPAHAGAASDAAFEKKVLNDLRAENPDAVPVFTEAMAAAERNELTAAIAGFERDLQLAPKSDHARRRLCDVELAAEQRASGLAHCRIALDLRDAPENHTALARAIVESGPLTKGDIDSAVDHAARGLKGRPDDTDAIAVMLEVQTVAENDAQVEYYVGQLEKVAPEDPEVRVTIVGVRAMHRDMEGARAQLEKARALGLPEARYEKLRRMLDEHEHSGLAYYLVLMAWVFGFWTVGFGLLLGIGSFLSQSVLRAAENRSGQAPSGLRRIYRAVIWLTCLYFYVSLPIVLVGVFVMAGGLCYAALGFGYFPIIIGAIALVSFAAVLKGLWALVASRNPEDPGEPLDLASEPKLRALLREVADKMGTRMVDRLFLTTGTDLAVTERGGRWFGGKTERCLVLGAGLLEGMPLRAFKAALAHEYGHFKNEDTAGGGFALAMQRSLIAMGTALAQGGAARAVNPAWWFVRSFHSVFLRISHGASRLQEILADRWAAVIYGSASFERGLRHMIERSMRFEVYADLALKEVLEKQVPLANFYTYALEAAVSEMDLADDLEEAFMRPASPYDSHPPPHQRIAWVNALVAAGEPAQPEEEQGDAWAVFRDRTAIEERMTGVIRERLAAQGILLPPVPERA